MATPCRQAGCNRTTQGGFAFCCQTCEKKDGRQHGPRCEQRYIEESKASPYPVANRCRQAGCSRTTQGGFAFCCQTCEQKDPRGHGPRCEQRFIEESKARAPAPAPAPALGAYHSAPIEESKASAYHSAPAAEFILPERHGDIFVSARVNKITERLVQQLHREGQCKLKASVPAYNTEGIGRLPGTTEMVDVPAYGFEITEAIRDLFSMEGMEEATKRCRCALPELKLNAVVQKKFSEDYMPILRKALEYYQPSRMEWKRYERHQAGLKRLADFALGLQNLQEGSVTSLVSWKNFVGKFVENKDWAQLLHTDSVLQNFGIEDAVVEAVQGVPDQDGKPGHAESKKMNKKALQWLSKAMSCYNLPGSTADLLNLAFAMRASPAVPGKHFSKTQEEIINELRMLREDIGNGKGLWLPNIFIHDAEMDDMLSWLLLEYVSSKQHHRYEVYMQLPQRARRPENEQALKQMMQTYQSLCRQVVLDPESTNDAAIKLYLETPKLYASAYAKLRSLQPPLDSCSSSFQQNLYGMASSNSHLLTEDLVLRLFKDDFHTELPLSIRVELKPRTPADNLLHHVSSAAAVQERRMENPAFWPDDIKNGWKQDQTFKDELLGMIAEDKARNVTDRFGGLQRVKIVLAWHGCNANIIESILTHGFAAFSSLDPGFFGAGNYVALQSKYACDYAQGKFSPTPSKTAQANKTEAGEYAVLLVACVLGYTYPITPRCDVGPGGPGTNCKFYGTPLDAKFSSRLAAVSEQSGYLCENPTKDHKQYHELVLRSDDQLLPLAVVYFK